MKKNVPPPQEKELKKIALASSVEKPGEVAFYYGFSPIETPSINAEDGKRARGVAKSAGIQDDKEEAYELQEKARLLRLYMEEMDAFPQHVFFYYEKPMRGSGRRRGSNFECGLDVIGSSKSVAEALLIQTATAILSEEGFENIEIAINSVGDRESLSRLERELVAYYRRHIEELPAPYRQAFKKDIFEILRTTDTKLESFVVGAPQPLSTLSDMSRAHFKEVLEFIESSGIPYTIDNHLVGSKQYASQTTFSISGEREGKRLVLGHGYRYNHLSRKIGLKKEIPAVGITLSWKRAGKHQRATVVKKLPKPKFYFIHLGYNAKLKSLPVIETLRRSKILVSHGLTKDKFSGQASTAENTKTPYLLIFGQKEAIENTVLVRDSKTRFQDTVAFASLPTHLKSISKA
ncbi:MAG: ATP phosphoribosyltransferase regulatory subunit [Patescibacteria group bacterium]|nr:ATP phosphoribosyltransferase regulatory subunit [bacterium]MDZ4240520.1 ATP phosphoribosyltransferase regulatory subunit [Patescibacteria group bacterium]